MNKNYIYNTEMYILQKKYNCEFHKCFVRLTPT